MPQPVESRLAEQIERMKRDLEAWNQEEQLNRPNWTDRVRIVEEHAATLRVHSEYHLRHELDAMERILAAGGDHADALIGGLRVMLRDLEATK